MAKAVELSAVDDIEIIIDEESTEVTPVTPATPDEDMEIEISSPPKTNSSKKRQNGAGATKPQNQPEVQTDTISFDMGEPEPTGAAIVGLSANSIDADLFEEIMAVEDVVAHPTLLIYGKNGTGKTTTLATAEGVLILVTDDGTLSIRDKTDKTRTRRLKIKDWSQVERLYFALKRGKPDPSGTGIWIELPDGPFCVRYIAFDTITKLAQLCLRAIALNDASDVTKDIVKKTIKDWGDMSERMKHWLALFKELPLYNVWLCQEQTNTDNTDDDEYSIMPAVNQSIRIFLQSEADIIGRTVIKRGKDSANNAVTAWCLVVGGAPNVITKDRTNKLKATMVNPSLSKIMAAIQA